jgi:hypothetical protein
VVESVTQNGSANAKVGKSDYEWASAGTRGNDEDRRKQPRLATLIFQLSDLGEDYDDYLSIARG